MHYRVYGQSQHPCLVLIHGFLGSASDWQALIENFSQHYYCVAVDIPGHGLSAQQRLAPQAAFKDFSQRLSACLKLLQITDYHLLGYSLGGRLALHHALLAPQGLRHLIIESAHTGLSEPEARRQRLVRDQRWAERWLREPIDELLNQWYQQAVFSNLSAAQRQQLIRKRRQQDRQGIAATLTACSLGLQADLRPQLQQLKIPLDFIGGSLDHNYQRLASQRQVNQPHQRWHQIANAGHNCHFEQPTRFSQQLSQCLKNI